MKLDESSDRYEGDKGIKITWTFGLIKGVDEEHIYIGIAPMVYAKIIDDAINPLIENWLVVHHPK